MEQLRIPAASPRCLLAYLFFHPTHLRVCFFWDYFSAPPGPAPPFCSDSVEVLTGENIFSSEFKAARLGNCVATSRWWWWWFPKWGPRTTHWSPSGFQVLVSPPSMSDPKLYIKYPHITTPDICAVCALLNSKQTNVKKRSFCCFNESLSCSAT